MSWTPSARAGASTSVVTASCVSSAGTAAVPSVAPGRLGGRLGRRGTWSGRRPSRRPRRCRCRPDRRRTGRWWRPGRRSPSALPVIDWVMIASCWAIAVASEFSERMLAATEASMGAATLALAATAPLIGAARSASRSTLTSTLSRSPLSRSPVSSWPTVSVTSSSTAPTVRPGCRWRRGPGR